VKGGGVVVVGGVGGVWGGGGGGCVLFVYSVGQRLSTAEPRPGTGPWHQLYRAARDSPGIDN